MKSSQQSLFNSPYLYLLALLSLCAACGERPGDLGAPSFDPGATIALPLGLFPPDGSGGSTPAAIVRSIEIPSDGSESDWKIDSPAHSFALSGTQFPAEKRSAEAHVLQMIHRGGGTVGPKRVEIPGEFDLANFDAVMVGFAFFAKDELRVGLARGTQDPVYTKFQSSGERGLKSQFEFQLESLATPGTGNSAVYDRLILETAGQSPDVALTSLKLLSHAPEATAHLERTPLAAYPVPLGPEYRTAVPLLPNTTLESEEVWPPGARLSFSYGARTADLKSKRGKHGKIRVIVRNRGAEWSGDFEINETLSWRHMDLNLAQFGDSRVQLSFEFETLAQDSKAFVGMPTVYVPRENPPTVLFITSDTHRSDSLGLTVPEGELRTPYLDALAQSGALFEDALSTANITNPSHIALMTGVHPRDTGIVDHTTQLTESALTLADAFRSKGYATFACISVTHLAHRNSGLGQGFDRMATPAGLEQRASQAIKPLESWLPAAESRPLFVWLHVFDAHGPYAPPGDFDKMYWDGGDPFDESLPEPDIPGFDRSDFALPRVWKGLREFDFPVTQYRAEITYLDDQLGRVFSWPRMEHALIGVTADHGESHGENGIYFNHAMLYPANLQVPLILKGAGVPAGLRVSTPVQNNDLARTLLDLAEMEDVEFPGRNLMKIARGDEEANTARFTLSAHGFEGGLTEDGWHLWLQLKDLPQRKKGPKQGDLALFRLAESPGQGEHAGVNLADKPENAARVAAMRAKLIAWLMKTAPTQWGRAVEVTQEEIEGLEALGYTHFEGAARPHPTWWDEPTSD